MGSIAGTEMGHRVGPKGLGTGENVGPRLLIGKREGGRERPEKYKRCPRASRQGDGEWGRDRGGRKK